MNVPELHESDRKSVELVKLFIEIFLWKNKHPKSDGVKALKHDLNSSLNGNEGEREREIVTRQQEVNRLSLD